MSDIREYASSVKNVSRKNILTLISTVDVSAHDLIDNVNRLESEGLTLVSESAGWAVTKSIANNVAKATPNFNASTPTLTTMKMVAEVVTNLTAYLKKEVSAYKDELWAGETMSVRQVYLLSTIEQLDFWARYSSKLLDVLLSMSVKSGFVVDKYLTKNELMFLNGSALYYSNITVSLLKGKTALIKEIDAIPELDADDENSMDIMLGMGGKKPELARGFGIHYLNPKYWYDSLMREIDLMRIRSAQEHNEFLAMKINQAINQKNGTNDASLDHRIEVYREKIVKNTGTINKIVESYQ
jgi:hypothetical protein